METIAITPSINGKKFKIGDQLIYSFHGRCELKSIESREISGQKLDFYRLEMMRSNLSRSNRQEPAIWLPIAQAEKRGLRPLMSKEEANEAMEILNNREYYFSIKDPWPEALKKLEASIALEGGIGLAKVLSYIEVIKLKQVVLRQEVARFYEPVHKIMVRELAEVFEQGIAETEELIKKALRHKSLPDS